MSLDCTSQHSAEYQNNCGMTALDKRIYGSPHRLKHVCLDRQQMLSAENIRWHGQSLWGLDAGKSVLTKYDFTSSGCSIVPQKVINMDADMLRVLDFVMVDDFTFIVPDGIWQ